MQQLNITSDILTQKMGFFSFVSKAWDGLKLLPSKAWDTVKNGAFDAWSTVKHAAGSFSDLIKSGAKAIGKAAPIVYHKATTLPHQVRSQGHR